MQGTIERMRTEPGFGLLRDTKSTEVFSHHCVVTPPDLFASLAVAMAVACEAKAGPKGRHATLVVTRPESRPLSEISQAAAQRPRNAPRRR